jgi:hypothetical protein
MMSLPSHTGDGVAETFGHDVMLLLSHDGNGAAVSRWRWRCQDDIGHGVMSLPSHAGDDAVESC